MGEEDIRNYRTDIAKHSCRVLAEKTLNIKTDEQI